MLSTPRLKLHHLAQRHREPFAAMHADHAVMADLGGPISAAASDEKFDRYAAALRDYGVARWAVEDPDGTFLGYCGVMPRHDADHPLGPHYEIGWRFTQNAWGNGFATEIARCSLDDAIHRLSLRDIVSYTGIDNLRSQSVMTKLGFVRDPARDFTVTLDNGEDLPLLVWQVPVDPPAR